MPRTRNPYPAEFREQIIALARAGRSVESPNRPDPLIHLQLLTPRHSNPP